MKTIELKIYKFSELSEDAKQSAIEWYRGNSYDHCDYMFDEAFESIKRFADAIGVLSIDQIDFLEPYRSKYSINIEDDVLELTGVRLLKYIQNNFDFLYSRKYISFNTPITSEKPELHRMRKPYVIKHGPNKGKWSYNYYSNFMKESDCPFTGVYYDCELIKPFLDFIKNPNEDDLENLIQESISNLCYSVQSEYEARNEDESIIETIEANEYEFTEDGERY